jgi:acetylglutamate kinase
VAPAEGSAGGPPFNVNADHAAAAIAGAMGAAELLFISDVAGVEVDGAPRRLVELPDVEALIARGVAKDGMVTKLRAAVRALAGGARAVRIGDLRMLSDAAAGTRIPAASPQPA